VKRPRAVIALALALVVLVAIVVVAVAANAGGDDEGRTTNPAPSSESAPPPAAPGAFPPEFFECMADRGFPIQSPAEMHSAPPQVLQECFGALHDGGSP
jgi:hypothetical protein